MVAPGMPQNPSVKRWLGDIEPLDIVGRNPMRELSSGPCRSPQMTGSRVNACCVGARSSSVVCWTKQGIQLPMRMEAGNVRPLQW